MKVWKDLETWLSTKTSFDEKKTFWRQCDWTWEMGHRTHLEGGYRTNRCLCVQRFQKKNILRLFDFDSVQKLIFAWTTDTRSQFQSFQLVTLSWITQKRSRTWFFESRFNFNYYLPTIVENCSVGELKTASEILETDFLSFTLSLISENLHVQRFQKKRKTTKDLLWKQTMCSNLAKLSVTVVVC